MSNYNEAREIEKRALAAMVERSFYPEIAVSTPQAASIMEVLNQNPDLAGQILKNLLLQTAYAQPNTTVRLAKFSRRISRLSRTCCRRIRLAEIRTKDTILVRLSPLLTNPTEL